ncbi:MAG: hypothetical protein GF320_10195 [Armatimonadia bacterium]|nr:hypothetical protein [Armatimonadia bacterium]
MRHQIDLCDGFHVLGVELDQPPLRLDHSDAWCGEFSDHCDEIRAASLEEDYYGVYCKLEGYQRGDLIVGMRVDPELVAPDGLKVLRVPSGPEAVFRCDQSILAMGWSAVLAKWLDEYGYQRDESRPVYERFVGPAAGRTPRVEIHVPIVDAGDR